MTDEEMAEEYAKGLCKTCKVDVCRHSTIQTCAIQESLKQAHLDGLKAGREIEKESEKCASRLCCTTCKALICEEKCECWIFAKKGAELGYNKANEWHYVKDELPRKSDATLCERMAVFVAVKVGYNVSTYGTYWNLRLGKFECLDEVYAWCYAPEPPELPKEIKEK